MSSNNKSQIQPISNISWLVYQNGNHRGILNKDEDEHFIYISNENVYNFEYSKHFSTVSDVQEYFGNISLFDEQITNTTSFTPEYFLHGYKIYYDNPYMVEPGHPQYDPAIPLYTKRANSSVCYAAGWYYIKFPRCEKYISGPKLSTLILNDFEGPFKTESAADAFMKGIQDARLYDAFMKGIQDARLQINTIVKTEGHVIENNRHNNHNSHPLEKNQIDSQQFDKFKQHLVRLSDSGIEKSEFDVKFLLNIINGIPTVPPSLDVSFPNVILDGGKFNHED